MADDCVDHVLVHILRVKQLHRLDTVLVGIELKINIVQHTDSRPIILLPRIVFLREPPHHMGHGLGVLDMKGLLIIFLNNGKRLFACRLHGKRLLFCRL